MVKPGGEDHATEWSKDKDAQSDNNSGVSHQREADQFQHRLPENARDGQARQYIPKETSKVSSPQVLSMYIQHGNVMSKAMQC